MRSLLPILSVLLALVAAGSIAYIAWELSSDDAHKKAAGRAGDGKGQSADADSRDDRTDADQ